MLEEKIMEKQQLIKIFKLGNLALGLMVSIVAIAIFIFSPSETLKGLAVGLSIGLWLGVALNHFIQIPKIYGNKDERELILMIIAVSSGMAVALIATVILLSITATGALVFTPISYMYSIAVILVASFIVRFASYKFLDNYL